MKAPTEAELAVLRVLWDRGPSTVREVHQVVQAGTTIGYTSTLKIMQNMLNKGLLTREAHNRLHIYAADVLERPTINKLIRGWMDSMFSGSSLALAMQALDAPQSGPRNSHSSKRSSKSWRANDDWCDSSVIVST